MAENKKNKELSEEVKRLQKMLQADTCSRMKDSNTDNEELCMSGDEVSGKAGKTSRRRDTNKRKRHSGLEAGEIDMPSRIHEDSVLQRESAKDIDKETMHRESLVVSQKTNVNFQPLCCRNLEGPGGSVSGTSNCLFQELIEYVLGLKFSIVDLSEGRCISVAHQSSGYSFTLTWMNSATGKNPEILYRFLSLGTFERVAPEWMTDDLMFSTTMCPIFFERVSRVVKIS
ncbi:uncharacterized protein LOC126787982 [Argentina anserina]|uniref:uncharacterized protein LOC126787982 n=1 Tax=Argentina anserina TaxID=57926 RepID=UPI002176746E|nr:uncharacterized protein LOC126787982 [Potentilla anserina]